MAAQSDDLRKRLRLAALELFRAQGFDRTTAAQIAQRCGVTARTFFRYFVDKREVLYDEAALHTLLVSGLNSLPQALPPLASLHRAFRGVEDLLKENRSFTEYRLEITSMTPALQERELAKAAALTTALAEALEQRGNEKPIAHLAAQVGMAACSSATIAWLEDPSTSFLDKLDRAFDDLEQIVLGGVREGR